MCRARAKQAALRDSRPSRPHCEAADSPQHAGAKEEREGRSARVSSRAARATVLPGREPGKHSSELLEPRTSESRVLDLTDYGRHGSRAPGFRCPRLCGDGGNSFCYPVAHYERPTSGERVAAQCRLASLAPHASQSSSSI